MLVLNKPSGLLSVPGRGEEKHDCLASRVALEYPDAMIVHRLDMETSGLIVMALGAAMQRALSIIFQDRQVQKTYLAVVSGCPSDETGLIDLPLITDWPNRPRQIVDHDIGKPSQTHYTRLAYDSARDASTMELKPITGRSHQLRVHMQAIGHSILGDALYADTAARQAAPRLLLHASELSLPHPQDGRQLSLHCPAQF